MNAFARVLGRTIQEKWAFVVGVWWGVTISVV